ncbi:MAG TPA: polyketide cyclase [Xanthomonadaceae bacterium]|nr:polyketide cyclase [Xanthomonadaceae bacterium]
MIRILEFLIAMVLVAVIFVVVGLALPSHRHVEYTTETNRPLPVVIDMLSGFKRFKDWSALRKQDPRIQFSLSGPDSGKGARVDYTSQNALVGSGSWEVSEVDPGNKIVINVSNGDYGSDKTMRFYFRKVGNQKLAVEITQDYDVDYGWNLFGRYAGLYVTRSVGETMKASLVNLNNLLATIPKFDYTQLGAAPKIVKLPAENLLTAPTKAKRANDEVMSAMQTQEKWLRQVIEKNGLEATGPLRVITNNYGADTYDFDLAVPVHKLGEAAGAAPSQLTVKLDGPVKYVQTQAGNAVAASYTGHMAQLAAIREAMKAWALVHGEQVGDHPYEIYAKGIATSFSEAGDFTLYWPLKPTGSK